MTYAEAICGKSCKGGFMVISFVIAVSLAMFGTLRSLAIMAAEQAMLRFETDGRTRADEIALDCAYVYARILMIHGSFDGLESVRFPVTDGFCSMEDLDEMPIYDAIGSSGAGHDMTARKIIGVHASFAVHADVARAEVSGSGDGILSGIGASSGGSAPVFHSRIHGELRVVDGAIDLIRI